MNHATESSAAGPLAPFRALMVGDSRAARFAADLLAGLGARLVTPADGRGTQAHSLRDPHDARKALEETVDLDVLVVVGPRPIVEQVRLDRESCLATRPALTYAHVDEQGPFISSGFYEHPELSADPLILASYGALLGFSDPGHPRPVELAVSDFATAFAITLGVVASLTETGGSAPALVQTKPADASTIVTVDPITQSLVDGGEVSRTSRHPWAQLFVAKCACGSGLTIHLSSSQAFWLKFTTAINRIDLPGRTEFATYHDRVRNYFVLADIIAEALSSATLAVWEDILAEADVPFAPLLTPGEAISHPQAAALALRGSSTVRTSLVSPLQFGGRRVDHNNRSSL